MIKRLILKFLGIDCLLNEVENLKNITILTNEYVEQEMERLKKYSRVDADIGHRGKNTIILTGVYNGRGYVHFYDFGPGDFRRLVEQLKKMRKYSLIRNIDAPPNIIGNFTL